MAARCLPIYSPYLGCASRGEQSTLVLRERARNGPIGSPVSGVEVREDVPAFETSALGSDGGCSHVACLGSALSVQAV